MTLCRPAPRAIFDFRVCTRKAVFAAGGIVGAPIQWRARQAEVRRFPVVPWAGLVGPAKMPRDVVERLNKEVVGVLGRADIKEQLAKQAFPVHTSSSPEMAGLIKERLASWDKVMKSAGMQPQ